MVKNNITVLLMLSISLIIKLCGWLWNICHLFNKYISKVFKWLAQHLVTSKLHALHLHMNALNLVLNFQIWKKERNKINSTCHLRNEYLKWSELKKAQLTNKYMRIHKGICKIKTVGWSKFGECLLARSPKVVKEIA